MKFKNSFFDVVILAGGESKRFGSDKCCFEFNSKKFLERIIENFDNPIVVTNKKRNIKRGIEVVDSERKGPVNAVKLALPFIKEEKVFLTGCDFPFITRKLAEFICSKETEISVVEEEELQPLLACYSTFLLREKIDKVKTLYDLINYARSAYFIGTYELKLNGFSLDELKNINSWKDFYANQDKYTLSKYVIK